MKTISEYSKNKTGLDIHSVKALDSISEWMEYSSWNVENDVIMLNGVKVKKDIPLSAKRTIKEGTEFDRVGLTSAKQILLFKKDEESPYRRIMKHPINEDAFPVLPVIWNDGRVDGPFQPFNDVNGVARDALACIANLRERLGTLTVDQAAVLAKGLGSSFEDVVLREVLRALFKEQASPFYFGLR